ncbi:cache domain-containing protein, partial [Vibrio alginolyticus]|nr:cache domain-containing protein [Vibrio alginolyticus]MDW2282406.1 cache domain-containing protein [Vibrio sp. 1402]
MLKLHSLSIKQKVVLGITFAVLASTIIVGVMAQRHARDVLSHRLIDIELPAMLQQINTEIDREVVQMQQAAKQLATNEFVVEALKNTDHPQFSETQLVQQLNNIKSQYGLNDASVANRKTAYYWNQNGFLRQLNHSQDAWFFGFTSSGRETSVSVFQEANGEVKMFTNYQDLNGISMSGLSKSMDDMVSLLNSFQIEDTGYVFLTNEKGDIQIHRQQGKNKTSIAQLFGSNANQLLNKNSFNLINVEFEGK